MFLCSTRTIKLIFLEYVAAVKLVLCGNLEDKLRCLTEMTMAASTDMKVVKVKSV